MLRKKWILKRILHFPAAFEAALGDSRKDVLHYGGFPPSIWRSVVQ